MAVRRGDLVFLDTNALIEAFRVRAWPALAGGFRMATVETCCEEAARGRSNRPGYVAVDVEQIRATALVEPVSMLQRARLDLQLNGPSGLDDGEHALLAHLVTRSDAWFVCSPDNACVLAIQELKLLDRCVSLEELLDVVGFSAALRDNYRNRWMEIWRTKLLLEEGS